MADFVISKRPDSTFRYNNMEIHHSGGKKIVRSVKIHNGKGTKTVKMYSHKNKKHKHMRTAKRQLTDDEIHKIRNRIFIIGLFNDCEEHQMRNGRCSMKPGRM